MIDSTLLKIIDYFASILVNLQDVAMKIGQIMALLGIIWTGIEMASGTKDVQKFLVGNIVRYSMFLIVMTCYAPVVSGLLAFATQVAQEGSSSSVADVTSEFGSALQKSRDALAKAAAGSTRKARSVEEQKIMNHRAEKAANAAQKKMDALDKVLDEFTIEENGIATKKYALDLDFKKDGKATGFLSPDALLNMAILTGQIMIDNELALDVYAEANKLVKGGTNENGEVVYEKQKGRFSVFSFGNKNVPNQLTQDELSIAVTSGELTIPLMSLPFGAFVRYLICWVCVIALLATVVAGIIQYLMCIAEYFITTSVSIILVPLMLMDSLKDYATKVLATLFGQVLKLIVITLMMYFCIYTFMQLAIDVTKDSSQFGVIQFARVLFTGLLTFIFTSHAPSMAQTIASGSPVMSMNEFVRGVGAATAGAGVAAMATKMGGKGLAAGIRTGATGVMSARNGAASAAARGLGIGGQIKAAAGNLGGDIGRRTMESFQKYFGASEYQKNRAQQIAGVKALHDNKNDPNGSHQAKLKQSSGGGGTGGGGGGEPAEKKPEMTEV